MNSKNTPVSIPAADVCGTVDIGGRRLFVECKGIGYPTMVLDAGAGCPCDTIWGWDPIWEALIALTRTCRYDRAGLGRSEKAKIPRTSKQVVSDLHALLLRTAIPGPYVMVGHSLGGLNVRLYAHDYPDEVVGLVLVDAVHHNQQERFRALLPPPSSSESERFQRLREALTKPGSTNSEGIDSSASQRQVRVKRSFGNIPLVVVTCGLATPDSLEEKWSNAFEVKHAMDREYLWQELQADLARLSTNSQHVVATKSGHFIQQDQPHLIIDAIRWVVKKVREAAPQKAQR